MKVLYISGSPRKNSNTDYLLKETLSVTGGDFLINNVSGQLKIFMDRTWCIKGQLRNRIGGAVVVGRRDGAESAITAIQAFFLNTR